jgi:hypothetical protein
MSCQGTRSPILLQRKVSDDNKEMITMRLLQNDGRPLLSASAQRCVETATQATHFTGFPYKPAKATTWR